MKSRATAERTVGRIRSMAIDGIARIKVVDKLDTSCIKLIGGSRSILVVDKKCYHAGGGVVDVEDTPVLQAKHTYLLANVGDGLPEATRKV
ncbi:hypothetical protein G6F26_014154 [Rhizopus arrhizus]|nr:hypothetical protein G6F26_014154 [Rhizopus arrhizus]KAG1255184.1 hypothetical protein G6F66_014927 [Rhizopus arrhizus]